jgi:hypothetical protein
MRNNDLSTPHGGAGERRAAAGGFLAGAGGFLHRLVAERDQRLLDDREQLVDGLGAGPSDDVCAQVAGTYTVTLGTSAGVKSLTSQRPRAGGGGRMRPPWREPSVVPSGARSLRNGK